MSSSRSTSVQTDDRAELAGLSDNGRQLAAAAPPLVEFDPAGRASIINYSLPETMSYSGRHVVDLGFRGSDFADLLPPASPAKFVDPVGDASLLADATEDPRQGISVPTTVVLSSYTGAGDDSKPVVAHAPFPLSDRLRDLTWSAVKLFVDAGKHADVVRSIGGALDYRLREAPPLWGAAVASLQAGEPVVFQSTGSNQTTNDDENDPFVEVSINSPDRENPNLTDLPPGGIKLSVMGKAAWAQTASPTLGLTVSGGSAQIDAQPTLDPTRKWSGRVLITAPGDVTITVSAEAKDLSSDETYSVQDSVTVHVSFAAGDPSPPAPMPTVTVDAPKLNIVVSDSGKGAFVLTGTAASNDSQAVPPPEITVVVAGSDLAPAHPPVGDDGTWSQPLELSGYGNHTVTVSAENANGVAAPPVSLVVKLVQSAPRRAIDRRLFLVETVAISTFLGDYGAGRLIKTLSLLPGEKTTISIETYRKDETQEKTASSILDSAASEASADFEDTLNQETATKTNQTSSTSFSLEAALGFRLGSFTTANLKSNYATAANSSREEMSKDVRNALNKHAMKASTNRSVTVNTEFTRAESTGQTESTKRELTNINVSRVLNFVFRQMVQKHVVLVSLVDARIGFYAQDLALDANDRATEILESYREVSLPEFRAFAKNVLAGGLDAAVNAEAKISDILAAIANFEGTTKSLIEKVTPVDSQGNPQPDAAYVRVDPKQADSYPSEPSANAPRFTVPGVIISAEEIVMRTDGVLVDAILGEGDGLDGYSHGLQDATVADRTVTTAERQTEIALKRLAMKIIKAKDKEQADLYAKLFPPPPTTTAPPPPTP